MKPEGLHDIAILVTAMLVDRRRRSAPDEPIEVALSPEDLARVEVELKLIPLGRDLNSALDGLLRLAVALGRTEGYTEASEQIAALVAPLFVCAAAKTPELHALGGRLQRFEGRRPGRPSSLSRSPNQAVSRSLLAGDVGAVRRQLQKMLEQEEPGA